jgi:hypothetical protein
VVFNTTFNNINKGRRGRNHMDLQLPMQSVPITTKVVSSKLAHGEVYHLM